MAKAPTPYLAPSTPLEYTPRARRSLMYLVFAAVGRSITNVAAIPGRIAKWLIEYSFGLCVTGYCFMFLFTFGHEAAHDTVNTMGEKTWEAFLYALVWPFYWSYQLQLPVHTHV